MIVALTVALYVIGAVAAFVYCRVKRELAPDHTNMGSLKFDKSDWELLGFFCLFFGAFVLFIPWIHRIIHSMASRFNRLVKSVAASVMRREEARKAREFEAKQPKPVKDSYSYREEIK